jgi:hypothetical protein
MVFVISLPETNTRLCQAYGGYVMFVFIFFWEALRRAETSPLMRKGTIFWGAGHLFTGLGDPAGRSPVGTGPAPRWSWWRTTGAGGGRQRWLRRRRTRTLSQCPSHLLLPLTGSIPLKWTSENHSLNGQDYRLPYLASSAELVLLCPP